MRGEAEVNRAIEIHADTLRRVCTLYLKNYHDTEDIFQKVFMKYALSSVEFDSDEHEKAWFIRVAVNACKDHLNSFFFKKTVSLDEAIPQETAPIEEYSDLLAAVLALPAKYKEAVYLHYYEGYTAAETAAILKKKVNTVYTLLARARELLRKTLGDEADE